MNRSARILFLIVALAAAAIVSYVVYQKTTVRTTVSITEEKQNMVQIAVAARSLNRGAKITLQDLRMASFFKDTLPAGHFTELDKAVGRVVLLAVQPTQPVLESALAPTDITKGGMAAIINPQKRAMAVKVDDVIGVAGFLLPGHLVDVLVSIEQPGKQKNQITKTVLENIPVLSIGTQTEETAEKSTKRVTVVTLEVSLDEGEKLAMAVHEGIIQLALRSYTDTDQILTKGIDVSSLLKSYATAGDEPVTVQKVTGAPPPKRRVARPRFVVEVMNGNKVNRVAIEAN
jgi:pilus assembly protein CpaB